MNYLEELERQSVLCQTTTLRSRKMQDIHLYCVLTPFTHSDTNGAVTLLLHSLTETYLDSTRFLFSYGTLLSTFPGPILLVNILRLCWADVGFTVIAVSLV